MKSIVEVIQKVDVKFSKEVCKNHGKKEVQKIVYEGELTCPVCFTNKLDDTLKKETQRKVNKQKLFRKYHMLQHDSLISDVGLADAKISNFHTYCDETGQNKRKVVSLIRRIVKGENISVWFSGNTGVGKSHLAMAMLDNLNEIGRKNVENVMDQEMDFDAKLSYGKSSVFVNTNTLMDAIRESFNNKQVKTTQKYMIDLLVSVDYLVLDDIGSEVGGMETDKRASDFVTKVMYAVANGRQDKTTIYTTNLSSTVLKGLYDDKTFGRLTINAESVVFKTAEDQRGGYLGF